MRDFITALALFIIAMLAYTYIAFPIKDYLCSLDGMKASYYNYGCVIKYQPREASYD